MRDSEWLSERDRVAGTMLIEPSRKPGPELLQRNSHVMTVEKVPAGNS